jgi:hypothetical protein
MIRDAIRMFSTFEAGSAVQPVKQSCAGPANLAVKIAVLFLSARQSER